MSRIDDSREFIPVRIAVLTKIKVNPTWACIQIMENEPELAAEKLRKANEARCVDVDTDLKDARAKQIKDCDTAATCKEEDDCKKTACNKDCGVDGFGSGFGLNGLEGPFHRGGPCGHGRRAAPGSSHPTPGLFLLTASRKSSSASRQY